MVYSGPAFVVSDAIGNEQGTFNLFEDFIELENPTCCEMEYELRQSVHVEILNYDDELSSLIGISTQIDNVDNIHRHVQWVTEASGRSCMRTDNSDNWFCTRLVKYVPPKSTLQVRVALDHVAVTLNGAHSDASYTPQIFCTIAHGKVCGQG